MRNLKGIFEMANKGLRPCKAPGCPNYGNIASHKYQGVVCSGRVATTL
jgi:hypothetical protein